MKFKYLCLIFLFCFSCNEFTEQDKITISIGDLATNESTDLVEEIFEDLDKSKGEVFIEDCIFDQTTQTDVFLKGIKELEGFVWDKETKTAEIDLNEHWTLLIHRGGCDTFDLTATFLHDRVVDFEENKDYFFEQIIWITSLLKEFNGQLVKESLVNDDISISKEDNTYYIDLMHEQLYSSYKIIIRESELGRNFSITYYLD